jgi:hypothetical protein
MTSPGNWRPLKGLVGVIGISLYRTKIADLEVRNETFRSISIFGDEGDCV